MTRSTATRARFTGARPRLDHPGCGTTGPSTPTECTPGVGLSLPPGARVNPHLCVHRSARVVVPRVRRGDGIATLAVTVLPSGGWVPYGEFRPPPPGRTGRWQPYGDGLRGAGALTLADPIPRSRLRG